MTQNFIESFLNRGIQITTQQQQGTSIVNLFVRYKINFNKLKIIYFKENPIHKTRHLHTYLIE